MLATAGPWDAVIDTSGYIPREVLAVCKHLEPLARQYVFMSTVSVYRGWPSELLSEASEVSCPANAGSWRGGAGGARTHDRRIMRSTAPCIVRTTCTDTTEPCR